MTCSSRISRIAFFPFRAPKRNFPFNSYLIALRILRMNNVLCYHILKRPSPFLCISEILLLFFLEAISQATIPEASAHLVFFVLVLLFEIWDGYCQAQRL